MKKKTALILFTAVLILSLMANVVTLCKMIKAPADDQAVAEDQQAADESGEPADSNASEEDGTADAEQDEAQDEAQTPDPLIAIVDYDTEDAGRIRDYMADAGYRTERVGSIDELDIEKYDGIIIPGGHSVTPSMYGAERDPATTGTDIDKDRFQFAAVEMYAEAGKPVLGICRGMQLVNNVFGGTTIQDMPDGWHKRDRYVTIAQGTWMYDLLGREAETYHFHHQCVDELGEGLYATEWDSVSGCIEAYEHRTLPVYGLQWHPDSMEETGVQVFAEFGKVVEQNMAAAAD